MPDQGSQSKTQPYSRCVKPTQGQYLPGNHLTAKTWLVCSGCCSCCKISCWEASLVRKCKHRNLRVLLQCHPPRTTMIPWESPKKAWFFWVRWHCGVPLDSRDLFGHAKGMVRVTWQRCSPCYSNITAGKQSSRLTEPGWNLTIKVDAWAIGKGGFPLLLPYGQQKETSISGKYVQQELQLAVFLI